jgi:hypothetical protein
MTQTLFLDGWHYCRPGSTQLNSFGPEMTLSRELLEKGERDVVLQYFVLCRRFWASGSQQLDAWTKTVREGGIPKFRSESALTGSPACQSIMCKPSWRVFGPDSLPRQRVCRAVTMPHD